MLDCRACARIAFSVPSVSCHLYHDLFGLVYDIERDMPELLVPVGGRAARRQYNHRTEVPDPSTLPAPADRSAAGSPTDRVMMPSFPRNSGSGSEPGAHHAWPKIDEPAGRHIRAR